MLTHSQIVRNLIVHTGAVDGLALDTVNLRLRAKNIKPVPHGTWHLIVTRYAPLARADRTLLEVFIFHHVGLKLLGCLERAFADRRKNAALVGDEAPASTVRSHDERAA